jgi:hypothetical protein
VIFDKQERNANVSLGWITYLYHQVFFVDF